MENNNSIDNMSSDELSAALMSEVNALDGKADVVPEAKSEPEPEPKSEESQPEAKAEGEPKPTEGDDGDGEVDADGNPYRKRIDRLLRKRDTLQDSLAEKEKRIAELESKLKNPPKADDEDEIPESDVKPDISTEINRALDEREKRKESLTVQQQAQDNEFNSLLKVAPNAFKRRGEILELAAKHPDLTFEAIDRILAPEDHIDPIEVNRRNAKRMEPGSRSRADLEAEKDMSKASADDQEKYLREQIASGKLVI